MSPRPAPTRKFNTINRLANTDGRVAVGGVPGLSVYTRKNCRYWMVRMFIEGKQRDLKLCDFEELKSEDDLEAIYDLARALRKEAKYGRLPIQRQISNFDRTFNGAYNRWLEVKKQEWSSEKDKKQIPRFFEVYVLPFIGDRDADDVEIFDIVEIFRPIWIEKRSLAVKLRGYVEKVFDRAITEQIRTKVNPALFKPLEVLLGKPPKGSNKKHFPSLHYSQIREYWQAIPDTDAGNGLKLIILSAGRANEILQLKPHEINLSDDVITVPPERMKGRLFEHRIPITPAMKRIIELQLQRQRSEYVFPGRKRGEPLSSAAVLKLTKDLDRDSPNGFKDPKTDRVATVHGFRSTFRVWASETTQHPHKVVEAALAHVESDDTVAAYNRTDYLPNRIPLMNEWDLFVTEE